MRVLVRGATAREPYPFEGRQALSYNAALSLPEVSMQDINPIVNQINDLKGRVLSLRGYL